jgi:hypothetical protein
VTYKPYVVYIKVVSKEEKRRKRKRVEWTIKVEVAIQYNTRGYLDRL